jgi:hypothetical protein
MMSPFSQPYSQSTMRPSKLPLIGWTLMSLLISGSVTAQPRSTVVIEWQAPQGCPQKKDVKEKIQKLLGTLQQDGPIRAEGAITRTDGRFHLDLVLRAGELVGTRSIDSNSCEDLAGAAAVALGLLIHSADAEVSLPHPEPPPAPPKPEKVSEPEIPPSDVSAPPQPGRTWRALVQAPLGALDMGTLEKPTVGLGIGGGIEYSNWQLQLHAVFWREQETPSTAYPGFGANVRRNTAHVVTCRGYRSSWFGISPCFTLGFDYVSAIGIGKNVQASMSHAIGISAGVGTQTRIYLASWLRVLATVGGQFGVSRPNLSINRLGSVYQMSSVAFTVSTGFEWVF